MVYLKLGTLRLNDEHLETISNTFSPNQIQLCDEIVRLWKEEPSSEDLLIDELYEKLKERRTDWDLSQEQLYNALKSQNLYTPDLNELDSYAEEIETSSLFDEMIESKKALSKVTIQDTEYGKGLIATQCISKGALVFAEPLPLSIIPQLDKQPLVARSKCCGLCSTSNTQSTQFVMKNNLDCSNCDTVWCSKQCKLLDTTHSVLKHGTSRNGLRVSSNWIKFQNYCLNKSMYAVYAVGMLYARETVQPSSNHWKIFESLCSVSQRTRWKASDSINVGGTFDASDNGKLIDPLSSDMEEHWKESYKLLNNTFPNSDIDYEHFLRLVGSFNLNQIMGQIYPLTSQINHDCEPNVRYDLDQKYGIKVYARKDIKPGEQLFMTYVNPLHGVTLRRRELRVNYGFLCRCQRCFQETLKRDELSRSRNHLDVAAPTKNRRKSSMKASRPSLKELLENGHEFDLEIPTEKGSKRRTSVRFDSQVTVAVEEDEE